MNLRERIRRAAEGELPRPGEKVVFRWGSEARAEAFQRWLSMICREWEAEPTEALYRAVREAAERL